MTTPWTKEKLTDFVKEIAGKAVAEVMKENQAKGAEEREKQGAGGLPPHLLAQLQLAASATVAKAKQDGPGRAFAGAIRALYATSKAASDDRPSVAAKWAEEKGGRPELAKALNTATQVEGGFLIEDVVSDDFIELLRASTVITALGARMIPIPDAGTLTIPAITAGSTGGWIGEGEDIQTSQPTFGAKAMRAHTYASLVPFSNKLLRGTQGAVEEFVRDDIEQDVGVALETAYLKGSGSNAQPKGLYLIGVKTNSPGDTLDNVIAALTGCMTRMGEANLPMRKLGWGLSWAVWQHLFTRRDGVGGFIFMDEMRGGTLLGQPFRTSTLMRSDLGGGGDQTEFALFELNQVLVGRPDQIVVDVSDTASYKLGSGEVVSAYQRMEHLVRTAVHTDVQVRHPDAVQWVENVNWHNT